MAKKKIKDDGIYFIGQSSDEVTGSQYLVKFGDVQCLLECGLHQSSSNDFLDSYRINSEKFRFKPSEIDYVFIAHAHIDHCGLLPRLVKEGFNGRIIATGNTAKIMKPLLLNSSYIVQDEARILSKRYKKQYQPLYDEIHVYKTLDLIREYDEYNVAYKLDDNVSFQWLENSHCIGAAQLQLTLRDNMKTKKILYTSDIGALNSSNHYVKNTQIPSQFVDVAIMESTYGDSKRTTKRKRSNDIEHLKVAIETTLNRNGTVIMPCFSFSRTQEILSTLYDIFHGDKQFHNRIIIDSKLSCEISKLYYSILDEDDLSYWDKVFKWENLQLISDKEDSKRSLFDSSPRIILSSSGFCSNGRIVNYLKKYLRDRNSMIIFSGYTGDNPSYLSYRIKNYKEHKRISINKELIDNRADCITLSTFSSHANYPDLIRYGGNLNTNKLVLVHGSTDGKKVLSEGLKEEISRNDKSYKVIPAFKGMSIKL